MVNCAAIIVVYNMYIDQSPSFESILKQFSPKSIFVLDNSSDEIYETHNQKIAFDFTVNYKKHSNNGLSATYNDAVKEILEDDFFLMLLFLIKILRYQITIFKHLQTILIIMLMHIYLLCTLINY